MVHIRSFQQMSADTDNIRDRLPTPRTLHLRLLNRSISSISNRRLREHEMSDDTNIHSTQAAYRQKPAQSS